MSLAPAPRGWPARPTDAGPLVKICGLTRPDLARAAVAAGADLVGIVHFPPSPRHLDLDAAAAVADAVRGTATVVALVVDADDATLDALVARARPDALQLHGKETPERVAHLAARHGLPVAKALGVATAADLAAAARYDALLVLDAKPPKDADRPGGHGQRFDWRVLDALDPARPFMLSGGLDPESVAEAVATVRPYAVDVSSGVETNRIKDIAKMSAFVAAVRAA
ncbi:phosphoribosylanthranilate isomerase [Acuticoccus mangrovi]|uniref:N-(5'-phosphoribosyl)anthranilate isomerase n=1 Tax=Acuticoccus mangrovi TaxID=2796142 RepID=A0A934IJP9_9HYPH|nr:phosphoribosylanthranilate isomerase [Acuticoccus mangrovi]